MLKLPWFVFSFNFLALVLIAYPVDFDTCASCFTQVYLACPSSPCSNFLSITQEQHPSHGFVRISKPLDLVVSVFRGKVVIFLSKVSQIRNPRGVSADIRHNATCDSEFFTTSYLLLKNT